MFSYASLDPELGPYAHQTSAIAPRGRQSAIRSQHRLLLRNPHQLDTLRRPSLGARPLDVRLFRQRKDRSDDLQRGAYPNRPLAPDSLRAPHSARRAPTLRPNLDRPPGHGPHDRRRSEISNPIQRHPPPTRLRTPFPSDLTIGERESGTDGTFPS